MERPEVDIYERWRQRRVETHLRGCRSVRLGTPDHWFRLPLRPAWTRPASTPLGFDYLEPPPPIRAGRRFPELQGLPGPGNRAQPRPGTPGTLDAADPGQAAASAPEYARRASLGALERRFVDSSGERPGRKTCRSSSTDPTAPFVGARDRVRGPQGRYGYSMRTRQVSGGYKRALPIDRSERTTLLHVLGRRALARSPLSRGGDESYPPPPCQSYPELGAGLSAV